jgi:hypothetical protein
MWTQLPVLGSERPDRIECGPPAPLKHLQLLTRRWRFVRWHSRYQRDRLLGPMKVGPGSSLIRARMKKMRQSRICIHRSPPDPTKSLLGFLICRFDSGRCDFAHIRGRAGLKLKRCGRSATQQGGPRAIMRRRCSAARTWAGQGNGWSTRPRDFSLRRFSKALLLPRAGRCRIFWPPPGADSYGRSASGSRGSPPGVVGARAGSSAFGIVARTASSSARLPILNSATSRLPQVRHLNGGP